MSEIARQLVACLVAAHFIGDFILQSEKEADNKSNIFILLKHSFVVSFLSYAISGAWTIWKIPVIIFFTHWAFDFIKASFKKKTALLFLLDQAAHLTVIIVLVLAIIAADTICLFWVNLFGSNFTKLLMLLSGGTAVTKSGSILIGFAVEPFLNEIAQHDREKRHQGEQLIRGLKNGGSVIGQLERGLIFIFVLVGQPQGIGFLIAAKSIFRFGEIKEPQHRMEAEYIIIGTLMSFGYGIPIAYATKVFLGLL